METAQEHPKAPEMSKVVQEKKTAMQSVYDAIVAEVGERAPLSTQLQASQRFLDKVRGQDYRLEQAAAKLCEYFEFEVSSEKERTLRRGELEHILPGISSRLAANDEHYHDGDKRYLVN